MGEGKSNQGQRGCATIATRMDISLTNAYMRGRKKTMIRERSLTRNILKRSPMVKLKLKKIELK
jgi:hypothetical protein